jgi:hypothetical protein
VFIHGQLELNERFRERRRKARRRKRLRRIALTVLLLGAAAGLGVGATFIGQKGPRATASFIGQKGPRATASAPAPRHRAAKPVPPERTPLPVEMRGVHMTMGLASLRGKLDEYLALTAYGLNTLELDVKDESGQVGFVSSKLPKLARVDGAARPYYDPQLVVANAHARGVYLIGRVVVFEDPTLSLARPDMALVYRDGSRWLNNAGLGWANEYDKRVWAYNVGIAEAAARAGFDEIQFDYVRFPSDGNVSQIVYRNRVAEAKGATIARFVAYAARRLHPLGVRVSVDLFGLAATHDLRIGQVPRRLGKLVDAIYPMVYPSHYHPGEYLILDPNAQPGRVVAHSLLDYRRALRRSKVRIVPWLQDFSLGKAYTGVDVANQITAARLQHANGFMLWNPEGVYHNDALSSAG